MAGTDEHIRGGYDIGNGVILWIVSGDPDSDRDIVGCLAIGDGKSTVKTEQELSPTIVISVHVRLWTDLGESLEEGVDVGVDGLGI